MNVGALASGVANFVRTNDAAAVQVSRGTDGDGFAVSVALPGGQGATVARDIDRTDGAVTRSFAVTTPGGETRSVERSFVRDEAGRDYARTVNRRDGTVMADALSISGAGRELSYTRTHENADGTGWTSGFSLAPNADGTGMRVSFTRDLLAPEMLAEINAALE